MGYEGLVGPGRNGRYSFPFEQLKVGESFLVTLPGAARSAWEASKHFSRKHPGWEFEKVRVDHGWRIFRTA